MLYNSRNTDPELLGILGLSAIGINLTWKEKVSASAAPGSGWSKADFLRNFDLLYGTYKIAVGQKGYAAYDRNRPDLNLFNYIAGATGIASDKVIYFLNGLYNVSKAGDIDPEYLNPVAGQAVKEEKTAAAVEAVKRFLQPAGAVVKAGPVSSMMNKVLVAGAAVALGYLLIPKLLKGAALEKAKTS